ncbi:MAG: hypothetical protein RMN52_10140 [Anaerolineae bacterium]|nr:hypothetical protein [Candidatus Roseilinea sp.]MDW8450354.1 hypothetical protein [Anaerolineae bacterium]
MSFTVNDLQDLTRLLATHPEWLGEVRRLVLTEELLKLPEIVRELAEAQRRTEEQLAQLATRVNELTEAQRRAEERLSRLEERVSQLEDRMNQLEERLNQLAARVDELAEAQRRTEERLNQLAARVDELAEAQRQTEERLEQLTARVDQLTQTVQLLVNQMAEVRGDLLEIKFREHAPAYFGRWLRRVRVVPITDVEDKLEAALTDQEVDDLLALDLLVRGRPRLAGPEAEEIWLAVEVSSVVDANDVRRAERRAALLRRAGLRAVPVAVGARVNPKAKTLAESQHVALMQDGIDRGWEQAYRAAMS